MLTKYDFHDSDSFLYKRDNICLHKNYQNLYGEIHSLIKANWEKIIECTDYEIVSKEMVVEIANCVQNMIKEKFNNG